MRRMRVLVFALVALAAAGGALYALSQTSGDQAQQDAKRMRALATEIKDHLVSQDVVETMVGALTEEWQTKVQELVDVDRRFREAEIIRVPDEATVRVTLLPPQDHLVDRFELLLSLPSGLQTSWTYARWQD